MWTVCPTDTLSHCGGRGRRARSRRCGAVLRWSCTMLRLRHKTFPWRLWPALANWLGYITAKFNKKGNDSRPRQTAHYLISNTDLHSFLLLLYGLIRASPCFYIKDKLHLLELWLPSLSVPGCCPCKPYHFWTWMSVIQPPLLSQVFDIELLLLFLSCAESQKNTDAQPATLVATTTHTYFHGPLFWICADIQEKPETETDASTLCSSV